MLATKTKLARDLRPGDKYIWWIYRSGHPGNHGMMGVEVEILRAPEPHTDMFGRDMLKLWARRDDTGQEAYTVWGPDATVYLTDGESTP